MVDNSHRTSRKRTIYTKDDIEQWFEYSIDRKTRTLYLSSVAFDAEGKEIGVDSLMAEYFFKGLHVLEGSSRTRIIRVVMNSIGGDWGHGMAIYDAIRGCPAPIDIYVKGYAMSMGSVILQAGRNRIMFPNSALMVHDGLPTGTGLLPVQSARNWSNFDEELRGVMYKIYAERSGRTPGYWKKKCSHDALLNADRAVEEGLADKVLHPTRNLPITEKRVRKKTRRR